jgi:hypothetical protein
VATSLVHSTQPKYESRSPVLRCPPDLPSCPFLAIVYSYSYSYIHLLAFIRRLHGVFPRRIFGHSAFPASTRDTPSYAIYLVPALYTNPGSLTDFRISPSLLDPTFSRNKFNSPCLSERASERVIPLQSRILLRPSRRHNTAKVACNHLIQSSPRRRLLASTAAHP